MASASDHLKSVLDPIGYPVLQGRLPESAAGPQYAIFADRVEPEGTGRMRRWTLSVYVLVGKADPSQADTVLLSALTSALNALDKDTGLNWTESERGTTDEKFHSFKITVYVIIDGED